MNSHVYCLPQKLGWNAISGTSANLAERKREYIRKSLESTAPFVKVDFKETSRPSAVKAAAQHYPRLAALVTGDKDEKARASVLRTEQAFQFGPDFTAPYWKPTPPVTFEHFADPVRKGRPETKYLVSMNTFRPSGTVANDSERGFHQWRDLKPHPNECIWQPIEKIPLLTNKGERITFPPVRLVRHDPSHEKDRWDHIRHLCRRNALSYNFRLDVPGYTGYKPRKTHLSQHVAVDEVGGCDGMQSTVQASYKEFPDNIYHLKEDDRVQLHKGPLSRMVTLTHPFNPFTQQTAYSTVSSTNTK